MMIVTIAWRNIWRNPRRTAVILIAVVIGVWNMIFLGALMRGLEAGMIHNGITTLTGNIQIHQKAYRADPVIANSIADPRIVEDTLVQTLPAGAAWAPRIRVGAVSSNARYSAGVTLVGIDPLRESDISFIGNAVTQGRYLEAKDVNAIVIGQALADSFETQIGRKLVLMAPDGSGEIASRAFRIVGLFRAEMQATEKEYAFIALDAARTMLKVPLGVSEFSILLSNHQDSADVAAALRSHLSADYQVDTWRDLLPILDAYLKMSDGYIFVWYLVVFIAMGFGIVNTILMAVFERMREFGLLKALGMPPRAIVSEVLMEACLLISVGLAGGNLLGLASVWALAGTGIDLSALAAGTEYAGIPRILFPTVHIRDVVAANLVVLILGLVVSLYPAAKAARFTPIQALAHN